MHWWSEPDRGVPLVLGGYFTVASFWLIGVWRNGESVAFYPWLWPWVFAAAGIVTLAYAKWPQNGTLAAYSGGLMVASVLSRAMTLLLTWWSGELSGARALLGACTWTVLGYTIGYIWTALMSRLAAARRR